MVGYLFTLIGLNYNVRYRDAGYVSKEWIPDFVNYRLDSNNFDAQCDEGLVFYRNKDLFETIAEHEVVLSKNLKETRNYVKGGVHDSRAFLGIQLRNIRI